MFISKGTDFHKWQLQDNFLASWPDLGTQPGHGGCEHSHCVLENWCWIHNCPFSHRFKDGSEWHSHRTPDGGWCNFALPTGTGLNFWDSWPNLNLQPGHGGCEHPDCYLQVWCWVHDCQFMHMFKDGGQWHAHTKQDGGWCNYALPTGTGVNLTTGVITAPSTTETPEPHPYYPGAVSEVERRWWGLLEPLLVDHAEGLLYNPIVGGYAQQAALEFVVRIVPTCGPSILGYAENDDQITISSWLLPDTDRLFETIAHETAHLLCYRLGLPGPAHGPNWEHMVELMSPGYLERRRSWRPTPALEAVRRRFHPC